MQVKKTTCSNSPKLSKNIKFREMMLNGAGTLGRNESVQFELFKKGAKIWIKDPETVWTSAELLKDLGYDSSTILVRRLSDNEELEYDTVKFGLPFLCNPDILLGKDDLTHLSYLHEPAVLNNLQFRFERLEKIYTYSGIALVAINPYADCSRLYGEDVILVYRGQGSNVRHLIPHVFAVAEEAFYDLREYGNNQSVIVSGESGAGKTVSAKFVMKYFTHVAASTGKPSENGIEQRVLASNPVMESIGNAKTIRNDNSSRFGKFIQINFNDRFAIHGAEMKTYLLEKSRVVFQPSNERNYHVFYQMLADSNNSLLFDLKLEDAGQYYYTNQGALSIDGVDDRDEFSKTVKALTQFQISEVQQKQIFRLLSGILLLGNIDFVQNGEYSKIDPNSTGWLNKFCQHCSLNADQISTWLCSREMRAGSETINKQLNLKEAVNNRDALAKLIYASVFNWIVDKINVNLASNSLKQKKSSFIGVLDIYGFESYEQGNSFEQFCINFANETLQQTFNRHVFKLEQAEYQKEGLSVETVTFYDNEQCINLISSLISFLDEQCKTGHGSDADWLTQMESNPQLTKFEHLQMPKIRSSSFIVKHYASDVRYSVDGFIKKCQDSVNEKLLEVVSNAKFEFMHEIMAPVLNSLSVGNKRKKTVAVQFRESLNDLTKVLNATRPHYIRCIKPNEEKASFSFEPKQVIEQLRACGVLETVRISANGYPSRWIYVDFYKRYRVLCTSCSDPKKFSKIVCDKFLTADTFAFGHTKVFMRTGQISKLEKIRHDLLYKSATTIQAYFRGFVQRRKYQQLLKEHRAAIKIQTCFRGFVQHKKYQQIRSAIIEIQSRFRAKVVRKKFLQMRYERSAIIIQSYVRGYLVRRERIKYIRKIILAQACVRRWLCKRELRKLKIEAKSVNHLQNLNRDLANKVIELHQKLDFTTHERDELLAKCSDFDNLKSSISLIETELLEKRGLIGDLQGQLDISNNNLKQEQNLNEELKAKYEDLNSSTCTTIENLTRENSVALEALKVKADEMESMREQLVKNSDLLLSDFRGDLVQENRTNSSLSSNELQLLSEQQVAINDLRLKLDRVLRANERLQNDGVAQQLSDSFKTQDLMKIQNLELLNQKYKAEIDSFAHVCYSKDDSNFDAAFLDSYKRLREESERIQEENIGLRALLTEVFEKKTSCVRDSGHWSSNSSEDGRLSAQNDGLDAYISNERLLRQYRTALSLANQSIKEKDEQLLTLEDLRSANDDEKTLVDPKNIGSLISENLILQKKLDQKTEQLSTARAYLTGTSSSLSDSLNDDQSNDLKLESLPSDGTQQSYLLEVFNVPEFSRILIYDLKPRLAIKLAPCLPAHLLLSAFRYFDHTNQENLISNLFNSVHTILKDISASSKDDLDIQALWLVNSWRLLNLLRQYSGETEDSWIAQNSERQNSLRMQNYNFEPIRNQLKLRVEEFYKNLMESSIKPLITPKIFPAILLHEDAPMSTAVEKTEPMTRNLDDIKEFLSIVHAKLKAFGADEVILDQVFKQIAQWMCSLSLNQLLYRKDLCTFEKAIQIKHNVTEISSWFNKNGLNSCSTWLEPLIQSCHLMQSRKELSNIDILSGEMTSKLTPKQIISILTVYNPPQGFEEDAVDSNFIIKLSERLHEREALAGVNGTSNNDSSVMAGTFLRPFDTQNFIYSPEEQRLALLSYLKLDSVARLI